MPETPSPESYIRNAKNGYIGMSYTGMHRAQWEHTFIFEKEEGKYVIVSWQKQTTRMGFEPTRAEHIGLAVQRLNHSATSSHVSGKLILYFMTCVLSMRNKFSLVIMRVTIAATFP